VSPHLDRIVREPLLHFLLIGLLLFGLFTLVNRNSTSPANRIEITRADIEQLQALYQRQWQRPPTPQELSGLIDGRIREEVLYREALALGLDRDDTIVRRRLAQKVEFLVADFDVPAQPEDTVLSAFLEANPDRYQEPGRVSLTHIYFSSDRRGVRAAAEAESLLKRLKTTRGIPKRAPELGDRFMLAYDFADQRTDELSRDFGQAFADALTRLPLRQWSGPVTSGYGQHLVYIRSRTDARMPRLSEVRERVATDWAAEQRRAADQRIYERLRARYDITIADAPILQAARRGASIHD